MGSLTKHVWLVVPCYNEELRLKIAEFFSPWPGEFYLNLQFVDDGSTDRTTQVLERAISETSSEQGRSFRLLQLPKNVGKAEAVRAGINEVLRREDLKSDSWIGYWDADLATPLEEVSRMLQYHEHFYAGAPDAILGSRVMRLGSRIERSGVRHYLGRAFATLIHQVLGILTYDSQCGAKLFRPNAAKIAFQNPFVSRWIFDVEVILRLKGFLLVEHPVLQWMDVAGSKLKLGREVFRVLGDVWRIRKRYLKP